ncbi:MAG: hypothetical protein ABI718_07110 [Acidobacteriota bacterium]
MTRLARRVILKRRAKDLFYLPGRYARKSTMLVDEILRSLSSLEDDKFSTPRKNAEAKDLLLAS